MSVQVRIEVSARWADCHVTIGGERVTVTASYISDGLGQLVAAVASVVRGAPSSAAVFAEEPGEYRWSLTRAADRLRVLVVATSGLAASPARGVVAVIDAECRLRTFAGQVAAAMARLERELGAEGYAAA